MKSLFKSDIFFPGLAMFSMFFGAGNIIFPLSIGQYAADKHIYALIGFILSAVIIPFSGVLAMILFQGDLRKFFGRIGKKPGVFLALFLMLLLGPLGSTPRCVAISYTFMKTLFPQTSLVIYSLCACVLIFLFAFSKNHILPLLGKFLTPVLLTSLFIFIVMGAFFSNGTQVTDLTNGHLFVHGLKEGYNTMDLMAGFFFSSGILLLLKTSLTKNDSANKRTLLIRALKASLIGGVLLAIVYSGFCMIAAKHSSALIGVSKENILSVLAISILGAHAGYFVCIIVSLACLTTAIALISVFSQFIQKEILKDKIGYRVILVASLAFTFFVCTWEFSGISAFLTPLLELTYPGLILLTLINITHALKQKPLTSEELIG